MKKPEELKDMPVENGRIRSTFLGYERDHGLFTSMIQIDFGGASQGFGGYRLSSWPTRDELHICSGFAGDYIVQLLDTVEVDSWENLPGTYVRVIRQEGLIRCIGNILEDKWFDPKTLAKD